MTITLDAITLPPDLLWADEFDWSPIESSTEYAITGALVVDTAARLAGRPITLAAADDRAWIARGVLQALYAKTETPGQTMTLTLGATSYSVIWRPGAEPLSAYPIFPFANPQANLAYIVTLRFTEV
jgi:hypothetical protein